MLLLTVVSAQAAEPASGRADRVYLNGVIFTADARNSSATALAIRDGRIVYVGNDGLYSYDYKSDVVKPLLLQPRTTTPIRYIRPVATANGKVFVTGLDGATGPIYSVSGP